MISQPEDFAPELTLSRSRGSLPVRPGYAMHTEENKSWVMAAFDMLSIDYRATRTRIPGMLYLYNSSTGVAGCFVDC